MDLYKVIVPNGVWKKVDRYIAYINDHSNYPDDAINMYDKIKTAIFSLDENPGRGAPRLKGRYANKGYKQIFVENYIIVYRIDEAKRQVSVITVRHTLENF